MAVPPQTRAATLARDAELKALVEWHSSWKPDPSTYRRPPGPRRIGTLPPPTKETMMARRPEPEAKKPALPPTEEERRPTPGTAVATAASALPEHLRQDAAEMSGAGTSDRSEDLSLPFLYLIQKGSPQVNRREAEFIDGAEAGDVLNTATRQLYKTSAGDRIELIHAHMIRREVEWITRAAGGGYVSTHEADTALLRQVKEVPKPQGKGVFRMLPSGHQLVSTAYHFVVPPETLDVAVIGLTSTGLQSSRRWNTMMRSHKVRGAGGNTLILPGFARLYNLRTIYNTNDSGDWFTFSFDDAGFVPEEKMDAYEVAKAFHVQAVAHGVQMGRPGAPMDDGGPTVDSDDGPNNDDAPI